MKNCHILPVNIFEQTERKKHAAKDMGLVTEIQQVPLVNVLLDEARYSSE